MINDYFDDKYVKVMEKYNLLSESEKKEVMPLLNLVKSLFEYQRRSFKITHKLIEDYMVHFNKLVSKKH